MNTTTQTKAGRRERRSWSNEEKRRYVERWRASGLSRSEYCRREGLGYGTFGFWVKARGEVGEKFALVEVEPAGGSGGEIELIAPNGWRVKVVMTLAEVMEVVGRC